MRLIDLTGTLEAGMWHYPNIPEVGIEQVRSIEADGAEAHSFRLATISGTYLETAAHLFRGRPTIDQVEPERFITDAVVIQLADMSAGETISVDEFQRAAASAEIRPQDALLFSTGWDRMWNAPNYVIDSPHLSLEAMRWIVSHEVSILGGDVPCFDNPRGGAGVNNVLFNSGALILAPLVNLRQVAGPRVRLMAFPLKIRGVCGAPCRVVVAEQTVLDDET